MAPDTIERKPTLALKDGALLRQQCFIDGQWVDADSGATFGVVNPATGARIGTVPDLGAERNAPRHRSCQQGMAGVARQDGQGAFGDHPQVVRTAVGARR